MSDPHLILISEGKKQSINDFRLGAYLERTSGQPIDKLLEIAIIDRLRFAEQTLKTARKFARQLDKQHRLTIARSYYAMYHTARAVVFHAEGGDDYQEHSTLRNKLPPDFPDYAMWKNKMNDARLERNKADYVPYPVKESAFSETAAMTLDNAEQFMRQARQYLKSKGCAL